MNTIGKLFLGALFITSLASASSGIEYDDSPLTAKKEIMAEADSSKSGHGVAPVVGYDPTYGFVYGGAYFYDQKNFSFGVDANLNFKNVYQYHLRSGVRFAERYSLEFKSGVTQGFDPYYGEGGETRVEDSTQLWGINSRSKLQLSRQFTPILSFGLFSEFRFRTEQASPNGDFNRRFPNERNVTLGLNWRLDTRANKIDPYNGFLFDANLTYAPSFLSDIPGARDFAQLEGNFIVYKEILEGALPGVTAAFSVRGGYSLGQPSYMYRYRLGGANDLRGYLVNRFRGEQYYLQQTELRIPIWKFIGGATYVGFGDVADQKFTNPKLAYGAGIRIGLPPDWVSKIRLDVGFGRDESGIFAEFGQTF